VAHRDEAPYRPFCSERCKLVDLGRWLDGTYNISDPLTPEQVEFLRATQQNPPPER
jgi:endogenous inhibitor of DNA gyrase (YacG/DUF329 family)